MADHKKKLDALLHSETPKPVELRRGRGIALSTEIAPETPAAQQQPGADQEIENSGNQEEIKTEAPKVEPSKPKRVKPGYELRDDLVKAVKRIALDEERHNYEVVEQALEEYIQRRHPHLLPNHPVHT